MLDPSERLLILREKALIVKSYRTKSQKSIKTLKLWIVPSFTIVALVIFFCVSFLTKINYSVSEVKTSYPEWVSRISTILKASDSFRESQLEDIKAELKAKIKSPVSFLALESVTNSEIDRTFDLINDWINISQPISQYSISSSGLTVDNNESKYFTNDLEIFLSNGEDLYKKSLNVWNRYLPVRLILKLYPNPKIQTLLDSIKQFVDLGAYIFSNKNEVLESLGHKVRKSILIINQNPGEARPTGGFMGSYIAGDIFKGRLTLQQSNSIYFLDGDKSKRILGNPVADYYSNFESYYTDFEFDIGLRNLNYYPCFRDSANNIVKSFQKIGGKAFDVDYLVLFTPQFIQNILPKSYSFDVPGVGAFNSDNFLLEIERLTSIESEDKSNPKSAFSPIVETLFTKLPEITSIKGPQNFLLNVLESSSARDIQLWSKSNFASEVLKRLFLDSNQACGDLNKNVIAPVIINISADKRHLVTNNYYSISSKKTVKGNQIKLIWKQKIPQNPYLIRGYNKINPLNYIGIQLPANSKDFWIDSEVGIDVPLPKKYIDNWMKYQNPSSYDVSDNDQIARTSVSRVKGGNIYLQPDGSYMLGTFIRDDPDISRVEFNFTIPHSQKNLTFVTQPGLNQVELGVGENIVMPKGLKAYTQDRIRLQRGLTLGIR